MNFSSLFQLGFIDVLHVFLELVVMVIHNNISVSIAKVILMLGIHIAELGSYSFSSNYSPHPSLQPNDDLDSAIVEVLKCS